MATFWGIEVKPGRPVVYSFAEVRRRLRISQATLGVGTAEEKSSVQCNIGNKRPVFICTLLPRTTESIHLDLEFEDSLDVTFSVIGPRSVYLTGYYVGKEKVSVLQSDTESYGEDIADTEEENSHGSDKDDYDDDDSFIDDSEPEVFPSSPVTTNGVTQEIVDKKQEEGNKRLQRQLILSSDSDDQIALPEGEDEEIFHLAASIGKKAVDQLFSEVEEKTDDVQVHINDNITMTDAGNSVHVSEEKVDAAANLLQKSTGELGPLNKSKSKRKRRPDSDNLEGYMGNHEKLIVQDSVDTVLQPEAEGDCKHQDLIPPNEPKVIVYGEGHGSLVHSTGSVDGHDPKKRKKSGIKKKSKGSNGTTSNDVILNDQLKVNVIELGEELKDQPTTIAQEKKLCANEDTDFNSLADGSKLEKPRRKKKERKTKKNKDHGNVSLLPANGSEEPSRPSQETSLSDEVIIEDLELGDLDGMLATLGRKVKVHYTAMLKETGEVFDSTIGKPPYQFRLGDETILDGWNVGIEGMRVGDRRRITIPPSMGLDLYENIESRGMRYGKVGCGEKVPPNSWVVFDFVLASVR